jgi:hypothetical protein
MGTTRRGDDCEVGAGVVGSESDGEMARIAREDKYGRQPGGKHDPNTIHDSHRK